MKRINLLLIFSFCAVINTRAQLRGRPDPSDYGEPYDWSEFSPTEFLISAIICGIVFAAAIKLKSLEKKAYHIFGNILIGGGIIYALGNVVMPIIAAITIIWQVFVGVAIIVGLIWWALNVFTNNE